MRTGMGYRGSGWPGVPVQREPGAAERIPGPRRPPRRRERVVALAWLAAWEAARRLPEPLVFAVADLLGRAAHRLGAQARARVRRNLAPAVPAAELDEVVRAAFRSYARYWVEAFRAADLEGADLDRRTTTQGFHHLDAALERGKGAIVLLAHHGSWDVAAQWGETHGYHLAVVAEVVRPRALFERFVRLREAMGLEVVPLRRGAGLVRRLEEVLAANHLVGLLSDRDLSGSAVRTTMFGKTCRIPHGAVTLARRTGAAVVPITMIQRPGRRWHARVLPEVDAASGSVEEAVGRVAAALEELICTAPEQWHAFQPVWEDDRRHRRP